MVRRWRFDAAEAQVILASAFGYLLLLFALPSHGDRRRRMYGTPVGGRPAVYALSLAIYCTSWTYFGSVGLASQRGLEFLGIYIGPILVFTLGMPVLRRIIELAKAEKLTSVADFISARYGKNSTVATIVALISLVGAIPYIALQLKSVSSTVTAMLDPSDYGIGSGNLYFLDLPLLVTLVLACFAIMFGTRHTDATEHQDGLILAIAMESVVAFRLLTAGVCVIWFLFDGPSDLWQKASEASSVLSALHYQTPISRWITLILLSAFAIIMLPRQFHVTVVENRTARELRSRRLPVPALSRRHQSLRPAGGDRRPADVRRQRQCRPVHAVAPLAGQMPVVSLITFIGGFSAATAMVIVASVAALNHGVQRHHHADLPAPEARPTAPDSANDFAKTLLNIRRSAIFAVLLLGYAYYRSTDSTTGLASIGLLSFAAIAQMAPAPFGGLIWRRANARGAILGTDRRAS